LDQYLQSDNIDPAGHTDSHDTIKPFSWKEAGLRKTADGDSKYFPDTTGPNLRTGQRLLSTKKGPPQLLGRLLIRKSTGGGRRALIRNNAIRYFYGFKKKSIFLQDFTLSDCSRCVVELNSSEGTFSPSNAFDTGVS